VHIRLIAVGARQPGWVDKAFDEYSNRLPKQWRFTLRTLPVAKRGRSGGTAATGIGVEEQGILAAIKPDDQVVLLDEQGEQNGSRDLAVKLQGWLGDGRDLAFIIGGPDGVSEAIRKRADYCLALSRMTLPHGLVRVLFAEQLYRAWAISTGHPYHRD